jgi:hypothetical protein
LHQLHAGIQFVFYLLSPPKQVYQADIDIAYLNATLTEDIYMEQPEGYINSKHPEYVWKLNKSLYGLKQAGYEWNKDLDKHLHTSGFVQNKVDPCIYTRTHANKITYIGVYVDDIIIVCPTVQLYQQVIQILQQKYSVKDLGLAKFILGVAVTQTKTKIQLSQKTYLEKILEKFNMASCNSRSVLTSGGDLQFTLEDSTERISSTLFRSLVGKLNYAMVATRPDLAFSVSLLSRFMEEPTTHHWEIAKRVLAYIKGTINVGLVFNSTSTYPSIVQGFSDSDYGGDLSDRKSTTGFAFYLYGSLISWGSRKQHTVALSTTEAEYMALAEAGKENLWIKQFLGQIGIDCERTILMGDNYGAMELAKNPTNHSRTKHIDIRYHFIRDQVLEQNIEILPVDTLEQTADIFTKPLEKQKFVYHRSKLGLEQITTSGGVLDAN